jgi:glycosyltransferase involved in cell wall biosynthesis
MTGPSELGIFAAYFAWKMKIPLAASWHTNLHEYAARRLAWLTRAMPIDLGLAAEYGVQAGSLDIINRFYSLARVVFAPNAELLAMLAATTGRPSHLMQRGVDTTLFSPSHRILTKAPDTPFVLGYVGRLSIEKNVALLPAIERELKAAGLNVRFLIVGHGSQEESLRQALPGAEFAGVLRGAGLSRGNVVLEALASGVPAIVTPDGGPKYIVSHGETGFIADDAGFADAIAALLRDAERLAGMRLAARAYASTCSWDAVFDRVYAAYGDLLEPRDVWRTAAGADSNPGWRGNSPM